MTDPRPVPELYPREDGEGWRETNEILAEGDTMAVLAAGLGELERGDVVSLNCLRRELESARTGPE
jgi:hypothetical protein